MDTNLLWEDNCGSPLHLVLIQESVIHSLDRPHLLWPQRQTCTLTLPRASDLQAWQRFWTRSSTPTQPARPVDPITHSTSPHLMSRHGTPHSTSQHLRHLRHTSPTNMQNANSQANTCQTPLSATNAYRPRSEPHAQLARHPTRMQHLQVVLVHPIEYFDECLMQWYIDTLTIMDIQSSKCFTFDRFNSTGQIHSGLYARKTSKHNADLAASAFAHAGLRLQAHL